MHGNDGEGVLYVVATPIGNLGDLSERAAEVLRNVSLIAAEDTRVTRKLLTRIGAHAGVVSYHENSPATRLREILAALDSGDVALVTDAGTPALSDPGSELVAARSRRGPQCGGGTRSFRGRSRSVDRRYGGRPVSLSRIPSPSTESPRRNSSQRVR